MGFTFLAELWGQLQVEYFHRKIFYLDEKERVASNFQNKQLGGADRNFFQIQCDKNHWAKILPKFTKWPKINTWLLSWRNISFQLNPYVYALTDILFCIPGEINNKNGKINQFLFWPKKYKFWPQKMPNAQNVPNSITLIQIVFHRSKFLYTYV